jgi:hypothetical protein
MVSSITLSSMRSELAAPHSRALLADHMALRHAHVVEEQLGGVGGVHADLPDLAAADSLAVHRHHDQRLVLVRRAFRGVGQQAAPVGLHAVGDPHFAAIDHIVAAVLARRGLQRGDVGAAARFADADAADHVAGDGGGEKLAFQFIRAEAGQRRGAHVGVHADGHRHAAAGTVAEGFGHHHRIGEVEPEAAVFLRILDAEQAEVAELLEDLVRRKFLGRFPGVDMRIEFLLDEARDGVGELAVFAGELHL